ncbi:MAG TPA: response regulator [Flavisolibacter sp.]|jgi:DNA-binding response OmpR family regulator
MAREKILVVDDDLHSLSKIYLALIHRRFKAEACNNPEEIAARLKRLKPSVIILHAEEYLKIKGKLRTPAIVLCEDDRLQGHLNYGDIILPCPVSADVLVKAVERLV